MLRIAIPFFSTIQTNSFARVLSIYVLVAEKFGERDTEQQQQQNQTDATSYDPWLVVSYIKKSFATDGLAEYFTVYPGIESSGTRLNNWIILHICI